MISASWADRRDSDRTSLTVSATLRERGSRGREITLCDISATGCRASDVLVRPGDLVWIKILDLAALEARVSWRSASECGLRFDRPLHGAVLSHLVKSGREST